MKSNLNVMASVMLILGLCSCGADTAEHENVSEAELPYVSLDSTGKCGDFTDAAGQPYMMTCANGVQIQCSAAEYDSTPCSNGTLPCNDTCNDSNLTVFKHDATWDSGEWDRTSEPQMATFAYLAANTAIHLAEKNNPTYCNDIKAMVTKGYTWFSTGTGWAATAIQANKGIIPKYHSGAQPTTTGAAAARAAALKASLRNTLRLLTTAGGC